ncbi:MAG: LysM peptidoglycan-binding domain-containing protein [Planctomycetota bacterium]
MAVGKDVKISLAVGILVALFVCVFWLVRVNPLKGLKTGAPAREAPSSEETATARSTPAPSSSQVPSPSAAASPSPSVAAPGPVYVPERPREMVRPPQPPAPAPSERAVVRVGSPERPSPQDALPLPGRSRGTVDVVSTSSSADVPIPVVDGSRRTPVVASAATTPTTYTVVQGDSLMVISQKVYGTARHWKQIQAANADLFPGDSTALRIGWKLKIPSIASASPAASSGASAPASAASAVRRVHVVQSSETLAAIARRYYSDGSKWRTIWDANKNKIPNPDVISVGLELTIPEGT